tara:strand:- start:3140 stop:5746 length:2607 start_codon:yes stop_codon:yes gene_type:complete
MAQDNVLRLRVVKLSRWHSILLLVAGLARVESVTAEGVSYEESIQPILAAHCVKCHSKENREARLDLGDLAGIVKGGKSGPVVRAGAVGSSRLWGMIAADKMPKDAPPLTANEKGLIRSWIITQAKQDFAELEPKLAVKEGRGGGSREHWAFFPPERPRLPVGSRFGHPIDAFVHKRLAAEGLQFSPKANHRTLARRAAYDLTGLPPTPELLASFNSDDQPGAYERMIDRLLADPAYGERWGRHWLDVAGYADSAGVLNEDKILPRAWRYRDYVIRAFNQDKPYDLFLREQIAGDELYDYWTAEETMDRLPEQVIEGIVATGFLRTAPDSSRPDFAKITNAAALYYYPTIDDTLRIVASSTMGLTLHCAKCHDHIFDPIPQKDYYRMQAVFMPAYQPNKWIAQNLRRLPMASARERRLAEATNKQAIEIELKALTDERYALRNKYRDLRLERLVKEFPKEQQQPVLLAFKTHHSKRTPAQEQLVEKHVELLMPRAGILEKHLTKEYPEYVAELKRIEKAKATVKKRAPRNEYVRALYDLPGEVNTPFLRRGDPLTPGPDVTPGVLAALATGSDYSLSKKPPRKSSGRRLAFAEWLTQSKHPLTARVMVNRIWMHHFGVGLVATPEDFGHSGREPSHPELLDWLACELVDNNWSVKRIHRLILTSQTYRQRSAVDPASERHRRALEADPDNDLLWRQRMRRLEAEQLRDGVLAVAGEISRKMFGEPIEVNRHKTGEFAPTKRTGRRSIYLRQRRSQPVSILRAFDQPVMETNCTQRDRSTVVPQALTLLNSDFMAVSASAFADRVLRERPDAPEARAMLLAFGRVPNADELRTLEQFVADQTHRRDSRRLAVQDLCHLLLSANEFVYVD